MTTNLVQTVLAQDRKYRYEGVTDDLFRYDELTQKEWNFELPTLSRDYSFHNFSLSKNTNNKFKEHFYNLYPELKNVLTNNVLVAGGCISSLFFEKRTNNDIDFFIFGLDEKQATQKINEIFSAISSSLFEIEVNKINEQRKKYKNDNPPPIEEELKRINIPSNFRRTKNCITLNDKYQVILRLYKTKSEILHGFDVGSSQTGFDGVNFLFTTLSKFSFEYNCNIVDTTRRSTTYEKRLQKYFDRGFDIILPEFDITKLDDSLCRSYKIPEICKMPGLYFSFNEINRNRIIVTDFHFKVGCDISDYDSESDEYIAFHSNIKNLLLKKFDDMISFSNDLNTILYSPQIFTEKKIQYFYNQFRSKLNSNRFPKLSFKNYITLVTLPEVIVMSPKEIDDLVKRQLDLVLSIKQNEYDSTSGIKWKTLNPGEQFTGSFNPIFESPDTWYGQFRLKPLET